MVPDLLGALVLQELFQTRVRTQYLRPSPHPHLRVLAADGGVALAGGHLGLAVAAHPHVEILAGAAQLLLDVLQLQLQPLVGQSLSCSM